MKNILRFLFMLLLGVTGLVGEVRAQQEVLKPMILTVNFTKQTSPYLSDYSENTLLLSITNPNARAVDILIEIEVTSGGASIKTKPDFVVAQSLGPGVVVTANQTKPFTQFDLPAGLTNENNLDINLPDAARDNLFRLGILPEGQYTYCINLYEKLAAPQQGIRKIASSNNCKTFTVSYIQPPVVSPLFCNDNIVVSTNPQNIAFTWLPAIGAPAGTRLGYDAYVVEIPDGQDPQTLTNQAVDLGVGNPTLLNGAQPLPINRFLYNEASSFKLFEEGKRYGILVKAKDQMPNSTAYFRNDGKSPACSFRYGKANTDKSDSGLKNPEAYVYKGMQCNSCKTDLPGITTTRTSKLQPGEKIDFGKFKLTIGTLTAADPAKASGVGTIGIREIGGIGIPVVVNFEGLTVNPANQAIAGTATVQQNDKAGFLPDFSKPGLREPQLTDILAIDKFVSDNIDNLLVAKNTSGFKVPFGLDNESIKGSPLTICITKMVFTPQAASFNAVAAFKTEPGHTYGLKALDVCFSNTELVCGEALLTLAEDTKIDPLNLTLFAYKDEKELGTHVVFDDKGFRRLAIHGQIDFPPSVVKQRNGQRATADIRAYSEKGWDDWIADLTFTDFVVTGSEDISFSMKGQKAYYDHSLERNPDAMPFSTDLKIQGFTDKKEVTVAWEGFYMPELYVTLPQFVKDATRPKEPVKAEARNFFIDKTGFTGYVQAQDVLNINNGSLDGWYFSVDKFEMLFLNSSYKGGGLFGKLHMPLVGKSGASQAQKEAKNLFDYTCTLTANKAKDNKLEFEFAVVPRSGFEVGVWLATMELDKNSAIKITNKSAAPVSTTTGAAPAEDGGLYVAALLNGKLSINGDLPVIGKTEIAALTFQGLGISSREPYVTLGTNDISVFGLNSPQRYAFGNPAANNKGFPIELKKVHPVYAAAANGASIGLGFEILVELSPELKELPRAEGGFQILSKLGRDATSGRFIWAFDKVKCDSLGVHGKLGPVQVDGHIYFFDDKTPNMPQRYSSGLYGSVDAKFPIGPDKIDVKADLLVGSKEFFYFYVNATVSGLSVPLGGPLKLTAFSGGMYSNMKPTTQDLTKNPPGTVKIGYEPVANTLGFKAGLRIASQDGGLLLQATGLLEAVFGTDHFALQQVRLTTQAGMICLNSDRQTTGVLTGKLTFDFDIANEVFSVGNAPGDGLHAEFGVGVPILKGDQRVSFMIDYGHKNWFFKIGEPNNRNKITVLSLFEVQNYFMAGNDIPPFPEPYVNVANFSDYKPLKATELHADTQTPGLAFGALFAIPSQSDPKHLKEDRVNFGPFYLKYSATLGFDMMLNRSELSCDGRKVSEGGEPIGVNGWYATGQVYAGFTGAAGVQIDLWFASGEYEIFRIDGAALLQAGLPNPVFMRGYFHGRMDLFDGLISGQVNVKFNFGSECNPYGNSPFGGIPIIADVRPDAKKGDQNVSILTRPEVAFNFPVNQEFSIDQPQDDGKTRTRRLKIVLTKLTVINTKTGQAAPGCTAGGTAATTGNPVFSTTGKRVALYDLMAFSAQSDYQINVEIQAQEWTGNKFEPISNGGKPITETQQVSFHTGDCVQSLEEAGAVLASYPYKDQRYLLQAEERNGSLFLARCGLADCLTSDSKANVKSELLAVFTSYKTGKTQVQSDTVKATAAGQTITFRIPALPNQAIVEYKLIVRKTYPYAPPKQKNPLVQVSSTNQYGITTTQSKLDGVSTSGGVVIHTVYTYYFGTSKYNTLAEKARYIGNGQKATAFKVDAGYYMKEIVRAQVNMGEPFDESDIRGLKINDGLRTYFSFPLIDLREPDTYNAYINVHARPLLYSLEGVSPKLDFRALRSGLDMKIDQLLEIGQDAIPRRPFRFSTYSTPLSPDEVNQYVPCAYGSCNQLVTITPNLTLK